MRTSAWHSQSYSSGPTAASGWNPGLQHMTLVWAAGEGHWQGGRTDAANLVAVTSARRRKRPSPTRSVSSTWAQGCLWVIYNIIRTSSCTSENSHSCSRVSPRAQPRPPKAHSIEPVEHPVLFDRFHPVPIGADRYRAAVWCSCTHVVCLQCIAYALDSHRGVLRRATVHEQRIRKWRQGVHEGLDTLAAADGDLGGVLRGARQAFNVR